MNPHILALGTAVPPFRASQTDLANHLADILELNQEQACWLKKIYIHSEIKHRHFVIKDYLSPRSEWTFLSSYFPKIQPTTFQRNQIYKQEAPKLAIAAALSALEKWGGNRDEITHLIYVSCTGMVAPGIEFDLLEALNLSPRTNRLGINFMGCFGAFKGISVADAFARQNPNNRVLVVCTELCSLHCQADTKPDALIASALFADGAAAIIVGSCPRGCEKPIWTVKKTASFALNNSKKDMSWEIGDHGYSMTLSKEVPLIIRKNVAAFASSLLTKDLSFSDCTWAIHPGGKEILTTIETCASLEKDQTLASWEVLRKYGNMSSPTFLFVLNELHKHPRKHPYILGLGFGPGLSMEGILLE